MIGKLNHVAIATPDLAGAAARYRDVLGADVSAPEDLPDHGVTVIFVNLPNSKIELLAPLGENSPIAKLIPTTVPTKPRMGIAQMKTRTVV